MSQQATGRQVLWDLFLIGFLTLFLELACIRWFSAYVVFIQFFTNIILLASFLGISCGAMAAGRRTNWLVTFPYIALSAFMLAWGLSFLYSSWAQVAIDVGHQNSPQEVFFGTEYRNPDVARFSIPIELVAAAVFVIVALLFVGLGQVLGRGFSAATNRVAAYAYNIGGSIAGIVLFSGLSFLQTGPMIWFAVCFAGVIYLLRRNGQLSIPRVLALALSVPLIWLSPDFLKPLETRWSPYYAVKLHKQSGDIIVNSIGHQQMVPFDQGGSIYSLIHLLERENGGKPFNNVLIIGAGSGNDVAHALRYEAGHVDAVEIDPAIQAIGVANHPDHPYQDGRVTRHSDDGRHFLRTTDAKYDLVIYALVDSLMMHSSYSNIRLESYLFTREAFSDVRRTLAPGGVFVTYNFFRQGWIVDRVAAMANEAFGCEPLVLPLPYVPEVKPSDPTGFTMVVAGCNDSIAKAFRERGPFWLNTQPKANVAAHGFDVEPKGTPLVQQGDWQPIAPTKLVGDAGPRAQAVTDDWPFLYISDRIVPDLTLRSMMLTAVLSVAFIAFFRPRGALKANTRMFFLGAAFMLLETKAVVQMALLFGSTWLVNSAVFMTALALVLLANLYVLWARPARLTPFYAALVAFIVATIAVPYDAFLDGGALWRYGLPCALALGPIFFAGVIFAVSFRDEASPDQAVAYNIAGSMLGGLCESFSTVLGFQHLLALALLFYLLSMWRPRSLPALVGLQAAR